MSSLTSSVPTVISSSSSSSPSPSPSPAARQSISTRFFEQASLVVPLAGVGLGALLALAGDGRTRRLGLTTLGWSVAASVTRWQLARWVTETAHYYVESGDGDFEVRRYASRVQAETVVSATAWEKSLNEGFNRLAGYIFGGNAAQMKIAMTAPVTATVGATDRATRSVAFKMPDRYALEELPAPNDRQITLRRVPPRRIATLTFRGRYGGDLPAQKRQELLNRVRAAGLLPIGEVTFGGYDAPWTLPWLRRNEVQVEISARPQEAAI